MWIANRNSQSKWKKDFERSSHSCVSGLAGSGSFRVTCVYSLHLQTDPLVTEPQFCHWPSYVRLTATCLHPSCNWLSYITEDSCARGSWLWESTILLASENLLSLFFASGLEVECLCFFVLFLFNSLLVCLSLRFSLGHLHRQRICLDYSIPLVLFLT